jgi:NAD(P)-dependent dehydrogenase (short-subunit alcohol dehydrogenase family)
MKKTIFITGASTGIGKLTAIYFAKKGWNVAATMRTIEKGVDLLEFPNIHIFYLDVINEVSIKEAITNTLSTFGAIDVVFNNAGYALVGAFEAMTQEQIKNQFDTNVFGVINVTKFILPYFREKRAGIIITNSSMGGLVSFPLYSVYHSTKWAIEGFMESLQYELKPFGIKIKNIEPGTIKTNFESSLEFVTSDVYKNYVPKVHKNILNIYKNAPTGEVVAKKVFLAANDHSFRLRYPVGSQSPIVLILRRLLPSSWFFRAVRRVVEKGIHS